MRPLAGIRVVDMSRVLSGPFAGRILSDLGADVVKAEPPEGDISRLWGVNRAGLSGFYPSPPDADIPTKRANRTSAINSFLSSFETRADMLAALDEANLAWGDIRTTAEAHASPTAVHRGSSVEIDARDGGTRRVTQTPYRFAGATAESSAISGVTSESLAPYRGEHNEEVLAEWLKASRGEIEALRLEGVLVEDMGAATLRPGAHQ